MCRQMVCKGRGPVELATVAKAEGGRVDGLASGKYTNRGGTPQAELKPLSD